MGFPQVSPKSNELQFKPLMNIFPFEIPVKKSSEIHHKSTEWA